MSLPKQRNEGAAPPLNARFSFARRSLACSSCYFEFCFDAYFRAAGHINTTKDTSVRVSKPSDNMHDCATLTAQGSDARSDVLQRHLQF